MYANRLGIWDDGHPTTLAELGHKLQPITLRAAPCTVTIKRERAPGVTAIDQVTCSNKSGGRGGEMSGQGIGKGSGRGRPNVKSSAKCRRAAWRILTNHGSSLWIAAKSHLGGALGLTHGRGAGEALAYGGGGGGCVPCRCRGWGVGV